jgi:hypothetical protein
MGEEMRKTIFFILAMFSLLLSSFSCSGEVKVTPPEISIAMNEKFINGNTSEIITLTNNNDFNVNLTWYIDNPSQDLRRPNRTDITNLSWIYLDPQWCDTSPGDNAHFYIHLNIPEGEENLNQNWEVWAIFKLGSNGFVNQEYAVRVYIDTPKKVEIKDNHNNDFSSVKIDDPIKIPASDIIILAAIITTLAIVYIAIRNRKS